MSSLISDRLGERLRQLRTDAGLSRDELAELAGEGISATVLGFMETGRPNKDGQRTRIFSVDEIPALAAALKVTPLELLGDDAHLFAGDGVLRVECPTCTAPVGRLEQVVRKDLDGLGDLSVMEETLVETAFRLAGAIDQARGEDARALPALTKELRATLEQIAAARRDVGDDDDEFGDLDEPE
ncbi:hypothetical protein GCM10010168_85970 [Actinoplanes ianthinogenes]|uniref:HTH cro/C1-type domain-containing protein n=1 Tax=Actinoplanes ianthinogenes TaxID=122358 RepID=A0ABN6CK05_9ACTN|nr:helix-turn-helix transcriptional regulator [Actinoplanes ianthinogenes]BCJ45328.1 hypothetical protein Aiant_59850 [Actinoplanes ianthinogenes]GGR53805.1 hypothetical protein GCM10010168_85970 [Actinoplanes ianthinogenes]